MNLNLVLPYLVLAYFLGAIPTAFLAAKWLKNIDIRKHGSGNVGATNAFRVLGKGPGLAVFALDFLKGAAPVYLFKTTAYGSFAESTEVLCIGLAALLGHVFTPFLGFKGGKGVATGSGMLAAGFPWLFLITTASWGATFFFTRIVSVSSLGAALAMSVSAFLLGYNPKTLAIFLALTGFIFWTHRANIGRILRGEEGKTVSKYR
jgi:acyl phosphate:glycerol-3-phosphate acyltransferase